MVFNNYIWNKSCMGIKKRINISRRYFTLLDVDSILVFLKLSRRNVITMYNESNRIVKIVSKYNERERERYIIRDKR